MPAGLRQATSTFGALLGASVAGLAFKLSGSNFILTFALSSVPAIAALLIVTAVCLVPTVSSTSLHPTCFLNLLSQQLVSACLV